MAKSKDKRSKAAKKDATLTLKEKRAAKAAKKRAKKITGS